MGILTCFIVIGFHMRNTLDKDLKELGILKAIGYSGNEIAMSYVLQFLMLGLLGAVVGVAISQLIMPVIISNIATDIGFEWKNVSIGIASNAVIVLIIRVLRRLFNKFQNIVYTTIKRITYFLYCIKGKIVISFQSRNDIGTKARLFHQFCITDFPINHQMEQFLIGHCHSQPSY